MLWPMGAPRCLASSRGGRGLFGYWTLAAFLVLFRREWLPTLWMRVPSSQLSSAAVRSLQLTIALHFGEPNRAGASPPGAPGSASQRRRPPTLGLRTRQQKLLIADAKSQPTATSSGDCPRQEGSWAFLRRVNNVSTKHSDAGCSQSKRWQGIHLGAHAKQPYFPNFSWARLNQFLNYNT